MKVVLQHLFIPEEGGELYFREKTSGRVFAGKSTVSFDTCFNFFSWRKWRRYSTIENLYLQVECRGDFTLEIISVDGCGQETILHGGEYAFQKTQELEIAIEPPSGCCLLYCRFSYGAAADFELRQGCYFTRINDVEYVNIAGVFCTFRREAYLRRNVLALAEAREKSDVLEKHFRLLVIDNDSSLDIDEYGTLGAVVRHNINAGGSGGFARGMMEALENQEAGYVLLMDDDVELWPESIFRMIVFLSLLQKKYRGYFLGGSMFSRQRRTLQFSWIEKYLPERMYTIRLHGDIDMRSRNNILLTSLTDETENQHNAWWMCCIPVAAIKEYGLPFPFFFKFDDIEYSVRCGSKIIILNGIAVWHEDFARKVSPVTYFFDRRNSFVCMALHNPRCILMLRFLASMTLNSIKSALKLDYGRLRLNAEILRWLRRGSSQFEDYADTAAILENLGAGNGGKRVEPETWHGLAQKAGIKKRLGPAAFALFFLSLNGHLLPPPACRRKVVSLGAPACREAMLACEITVLGEDGKTLEVHKMDRRRFFSLGAGYAREAFLFLLAWGRLKKDFRQNFGRLTSAAHWRKYLKLDG